MQFKDFLEFYHNIFIPIYSDTVAYLADKPVQIIIEIENAFAHLIVYLDNDTDQETKEDNLKKAYNHIARAALDSYKILWVKMSDDIDELVHDETKRKFVTNIPERTLMENFVTFKEKAKEARRIEIQNVGRNNIIKTINAYKEAIEAGWNILRNIDPDKLASYKKFTVKRLIRDQWIGFFIGIFASLVATWLLQLFS